VSLWRFRFYLRPYALRFVSMAVFAGLGIAATIVVERLHDYLERSFLPGRSFCSPLDFVHHAEVVSLRGDSYRLKDRDLGRPNQRGQRRPMTNQGSKFTCREGVNFQLPLTARHDRGNRAAPEP
jgi:hypothetical protein